MMIDFVFNSLDSLFTAIGILGMIVILFSYFMLQLRRWHPNGPKYLVGNIIGSICLLISLFWAWNLALVMLQCAWLVISFVSLAKYYRNPNRAEPQ